MKLLSHLVFLSMGLLGASSPLSAQIRDNDASVATLATHCAVSSGFSASDYEDYCRRLAKTLSLLSSAQQTRVFGYLPMASGSIGSDASESGFLSSPSTSPSPETKGAEKQGAAALPEKSTDESPKDTVGNASAPAVGSETGGKVDDAQHAPQVQADSNFLLDLVKRVNNTLDGTTESASTIVAGPTGNELSGSTDPVADLTEQLAKELTSEKQVAGGSSSREAIMKWLQEFEAAYRGGTLRSFLSGN